MSQGLFCKPETGCWSGELAAPTGLGHSRSRVRSSVPGKRAAAAEASACQERCLTPTPYTLNPKPNHVSGKLLAHNRVFQRRKKKRNRALCERRIQHSGKSHRQNKMSLQRPRMTHLGGKLLRRHHFGMRSGKVLLEVLKVDLKVCL